MTGGCTCAIYNQEVGGVEKGGVIIRYTIRELLVSKKEV